MRGNKSGGSLKYMAKTHTDALLATYSANKYLYK